MNLTFLLRTTATAVLIATVFIVPSGSVLAQSATGSTSARTESAGDLIKQFQSMTGARILGSGNFDLTTLVTIPAQGFGTRAQALNTLVTSLNAHWRKVYIVTPADAQHPEVSLPNAEKFTDGKGQVAFQTQAIAAASAITAVAQADGASVVVADGVSKRPVSIDSSTLTVPEALSLVSAQTGTNWTLAYRLLPGSSFDSSGVTASNPDTIVPVYTSRDGGRMVTDPTLRIPGYYSPVFVHMLPAKDQVTYNAAGYVIPSPQQSTLPFAIGPSVYTPAGSGLIFDNGYNNSLGYFGLTTPYAATVPYTAAVTPPAVTTTTTNQTPAATTGTAPATTTTTTVVP